MPNWIQSAVVVPGAAGNLDKREQWPNNVTLRFLKGSWLTRLWISTSTSQEPVRGSLWFGLTVEIQRSFSRKGTGSEPALKLPSWWKQGFCYQSSCWFLSNHPKFNRQIVSAVVCRFVLLKTSLLLIHSNWNRVSKSCWIFKNLLSKLWAPQKKVLSTPLSNTERETSGQSISKQNNPQRTEGKLW